MRACWMTCTLPDLHTRLGMPLRPSGPAWQLRGGEGAWGVGVLQWVG